MICPWDKKTVLKDSGVETILGRWYCSRCGAWFHTSVVTASQP